MDPALGDVVKLALNHWLRPGETGTIVAIDGNKAHAYLVRFARAYPGGGIDGDKLYLAPTQFTRVEKRKRGRRAAQPA